ncbi:MAG: carbohydrate kinase [Treponema sp.]|jgi:fructokinase|nr:carbohydrate kinase [Treponema sp.]
MFDVVALGELLIDFTPAGTSAAGMRLFEQNPGGAPANVLTALSNLGMRTAFIGKVGADMHGDFLRQVLAEKNIDTSGLLRDGAAFTTLAFVGLNDSGERSFSFARRPGADTCLRPDELPRGILSRCGIFHFGSLSLTDEPARSATLEAIKTARAAGALVSYDPNYRPPLWENEAAAARMMRSVIGSVDLIKISGEELPLLTGEDDREKGARILLDQGVSCVVVTLGKRGADALTRKCAAYVPAPEVPVLDTTGAGDAFWGGFLYKLLQAGRPPADLTRRQLAACNTFANAVASLCVRKRGAIPAMPTLAEVTAFMEKRFSC